VGWQAISYGDFLHLVPIADRQKHETSPWCWCQPDTNGEKLFVHNSMDRREVVDEDYAEAR
jgi:hypothetical protein